MLHSPCNNKPRLPCIFFDEHVMKVVLTNWKDLEEALDTLFGPGVQEAFATKKLQVAASQAVKAPSKSYHNDWL